jgi:predicted trehalose synthase
MKQLDATEKSFQQVIDEARLYRHGVVTLLESQANLGGSFADVLASFENEPELGETAAEKAAVLYKQKMDEGLQSLTSSLVSGHPRPQPGNAAGVLHSALGIVASICKEYESAHVFILA